MSVSFGALGLGDGLGDAVGDSVETVLPLDEMDGATVDDDAGIDGAVASVACDVGAGAAAQPITASDRINAVPSIAISSRGSIVELAVWFP